MHVEETGPGVFERFKVTREGQVLCRCGHAREVHGGGSPHACMVDALVTLHDGADDVGADACDCRSFCAASPLAPERDP